MLSMLKSCMGLLQGAHRALVGSCPVLVHFCLIQHDCSNRVDRPRRNIYFAIHQRIFWTLRRYFQKRLRRGSISLPIHPKPSGNFEAKF